MLPRTGRTRSVLRNRSGTGVEHAISHFKQFDVLPVCCLPRRFFAAAEAHLHRDTRRIRAAAAASHAVRLEVENGLEPRRLPLTFPQRPDESLGPSKNHA